MTGHSERDTEPVLLLDSRAATLACAAAIPVV